MNKGIFMGYSKLFRFISIVSVPTKYKLSNAEMLLKLFYIQSKEIGNKKVLQRNERGLKNGKVRFNLIINATKEKDNGLNAIKTEVVFLKD